MKRKPIRILHIVTIMNLGGIETLLMTIYRDIDKEKIQFDFLVHRKEKGFFDDEILEIGGKIHRIIPLSPLTILSYYKQFKKILIDNKYQIVHSHLNANSAITLGLAKKIKVKNRIAHSHIDKEEGKSVFLKKILKKHVNKVATKRFACSIKAGEWLFQNEDFVVFKNAIKSSEFEFSKVNRNIIRENLGIDTKCTVVGNIAVFRKQKNHQFIIEVFKEFSDIYEGNAKLLLLGDGDLREEIESEIRKLNLKDKVILAGFIGNANEYLSAMDLFLFPSLFEGLGIAVVEAQANGLPVLMSDVIPKEAIVTDLVEVESLDVSSKIWAKKLFEISKNKYDRNSYIKDVVEKGYDINENTDKLLQFYLSL